MEKRTNKPKKYEHSDESREREKKRGKKDCAIQQSLILAYLGPGEIKLVVCRKKQTKSQKQKNKSTTHTQTRKV